MIVSHRHKFIFLKTRKTAGTSIEIALSEFCGEDDIITPISRNDEKLRSRGPQHHLAPWTDYDVQDWILLILKRRRKARFYNHMPAREIRALIDQGTWDTYYKFCFERNPWDKVLSFYHWRFRSEPRFKNLRSRLYPIFGGELRDLIRPSFVSRPSLSEFIRSGEIGRVSAFDAYTIDGRVVMDHIGRYENLDKDFEAICDHLSLPAAQLPHAKGGTRKNRRHYTDVLGKEEREQIASVFSREIAYFGYEF